MPKTKKYKNIPILSDRFFEILKEHLEVLNDEDYVVKFRSFDHYSKLFKRLKQKLNLNPKINLYSVRHKAATKLYLQTLDPKFISIMLGNDVDMAMRVYVNPAITEYDKYRNNI